MTFSEYHLELPARCVCPLAGSGSETEDAHKFVIGTCSEEQNNEMHLLEFRDDTKNLQNIDVWSHPEEILELTSSPSSSAKEQYLSTSSRTQLRILKLNSESSAQPEVIFTKKGKFRFICWNMEGVPTTCKAIYNNDHVVDIRLERDSMEILATLDIFCSEESSLHTENVITYATADPHHASLMMCSTAAGSLYLFDTRVKNFTEICKKVDWKGYNEVTSLSISPTHSNTFLTCHYDGMLALHDLRYSDTMLTNSNSNNNNILLKRNSSAYNLYEMRTRFMFQAHDHKVYKALFNPFHDDIILSISSDQTLKLWDVNTATNEVLCINNLNEFDDSVYDVTWSNSSPWVYAGVSYNGHVMVDSVPNEKRMSILLEEDK